MVISREELVKKAFEFLTRGGHCSTEKTRFTVEEATRICQAATDASLEGFVEDFRRYPGDDNSFARFQFLFYVRENYAAPDVIPLLFDRIYTHPGCEEKDYFGILHKCLVELSASEIENARRFNQQEYEL